MTNLQFQVIDWRSHDDCEHDGEKEVEKFTIRLFGRTENNETVYLKVEDFTPYFYVEVPTTWGGLTVQEFVKHVKKNMNSRYVGSLLKFDIVERYVF